MTPRIISYYVHDSSFYLVLVTYSKTYVEKKLHNDEWPLRCICEQAFMSWIKSSVNWNRSNRATYAWKKKSEVAFFENNGKKQNYQQTLFYVLKIPVPERSL